MRVVLDTNIVVAAIRSPVGASAVLIRDSFRGNTRLLISVALALEYEEVCLRPGHRIASGTSEPAVRTLLEALIEIAEPVAIRYQWRPQLRDPSDEMVLEAAVNGRADAIVTFNQRDFGHSPARFGIEVTSPGDILRRIVQ